MGVVCGGARVACAQAREPFGGVENLGYRNRFDWLRTNALALAIRFFVNAAAFSYWLAHPTAATHAMGGIGLPVDLTLEPGHATAALFGLSGDSMVDWAAAKVPFLQKEIPAVQQ